eukprot:COSAG04_NODE_13108_length_620_cov_0.725528_2_plen_95_part_01
MLRFELRFGAAAVSGARSLLNCASFYEYWSPGRRLSPAQAVTSTALSRSPTQDDAVIADLARLLHAGVGAAQPEPSRTQASAGFEPLFLDYEQAL